MSAPSLVIPAKAGIQRTNITAEGVNWIPACAGMTNEEGA
jgi:hypothetical protein